MAEIVAEWKPSIASIIQTMVVIRTLGKLFISVGMGVLLFVGWTLWGTGLYTARQQDRLERQFERQQEVEAVETRGYHGPPVGFDPGPGVPVFRIQIPSIDLSRIVVEGVGVDELRTGPGHYPECRPGFEAPLCTPFKEIWPGERGRVIVSGHRTTYGQPFWDLDQLSKRDVINVQTKWGDFEYLVSKIETVPGNSRAIVVQSNDAQLVLTTCHPKFSAAERLIVYADMVVR